MPALDQSESASSSSGSSLSSSPARRIRFAPLPDPRAAPDDDVEPRDHKPCVLPDVVPIAQPRRPLSLLRPFRRNSEEVVTISDWRFRLSPPALSPKQSAQAHAQLAAPTIRPGPGGGRTPRRPVSLDAKATPLRIGTRMLNGRVYGARKSTNPFASARDEDPEFVEWGHGGMGSVRGAQHAGIPMNGRWDRLHSAAAAADEDECDGSGMGWVKKRKEARERAQREKEQQQQPTTPAPSPADPPPETLEHNLTTVNIPHLARHRRPSSRTTSAEGVPTTRASSETESETESESTPDDDDEDDEDEEDVLQRRRKTALGAGVEKVSRHHD